jgi:transcriptional regulator GlxA family with amidase domain
LTNTPEAAAAQTGEEHKLKIGIVVFDVVEEQDFVGPFEVLKLALNYGANATVGLYSTTESLVLTGSNGLRFHADATLGADPLDLVIVPGGGWNDRGNGGSWDEVQRGWLPKTLVEMHVDARVVDEGDVLTSAGVVAGLDLGLWLVERFFGKEIYADVENELEYERRTPIWAREPDSTV